MIKEIHKGDDFLSIEEAVGSLVTQMGLVTISREQGDVAVADFTITVRKKRTKSFNIPHSKAEQELNLENSLIDKETQMD